MNDTYNINSLIRKYISNTLTADELMTLRQTIKGSSDDEIASMPTIFGITQPIG
jgi:hypothetical protein